MFSITQLNTAKRLMKLSFPRQDGPQATLLIEDLAAHEGLSKDFEFTLTLLSDNAEIELKDVQCKMVCVELMRDDYSKRYFNGYCFEFALHNVQNGVAMYQMVLRPWLAFLDLRIDHYIFQHQTLAEQTKEIFTDYGMASFDLKIREADATRTFSCQYGESDYNYLHRHWEELGWHYWYEHSESGHRLILSDYSSAAPPIDGKPIIPYHHDGGSNKADKISSWTARREIVAGKVSFASFDFKSPTPLRVTDTSHHKQGDIHKIEVYQYRGLYGFKDSTLGELLAKRRMEQIDAYGKYFLAKGDSRYVQVGRWFTLAKNSLTQMFAGSASENEYLILTASHEAHNNLLNSSGGEAYYENSFTCQRKIIRWRPEVGHNSSATKVAGVDSATVVGPAGEEVYCDKYSRIKVQFHWDRMGKNNEKSSCWIRVMTPWADKNFGTIYVPRIGTEVVIQYLQGNPDRPIVTGQLYNQRHMPPWSLPANQTQSGILSRSSKGGSPANANALRFEDKKGAEQVYIQAERNMDVLVKHNDSQSIGNDRAIAVHGNHSEKIDKNMSITVDGGLIETIQKDMTLKVVEGKQDSVIKGDITITSEAGQITVSAKTQIKFVVGNSSITMTPSTIVVHGDMIDFNP